MSRRKKIQDYIDYLYLRWNYGKDLKSADVYCMFIGYPRSGHSLIGSLLDAHPNIIISHELNVLRQLSRGHKEQRIYCEILKNTQNYAKMGRKETGYSYQVPNQWQGKYQELKVIGDKQGGGTTRMIGEDPQLIDLLYKSIQKPIKFIHVTRNPYDNISSIVRRDSKRLGLDFKGCIERYFSYCQTIANFKEKIKKENCYDLKHEYVIENPKIQLEKLCGFLGQETSEDYLEDCASIVFDAPQKSRSRYEWDQNLIELVQGQIEQFSFLQGYSYTD